jgi:hypothetical protein
MTGSTRRVVYVSNPNPVASPVAKNPLSRSTRFIIRAILYLEITVNVINGLVSMFTPVSASTRSK